MKNDTLLHQWINGTISSEDLKIFKERPEYPELKRLYEATEGLNIDRPSLEKSLEDILKSSKSSTKSQSKTNRRTFIISFLAAASIAFVATTFFLNSSKDIVIDVAQQEKQEIKLLDGSMVYLNAESQLVYNENNWEKARNLELTGEAFFEINKGSKCVVKTSAGNIEVLGTAFNVRSRENILEVICQEGKVAVKHKSTNEAVILTKQDAIRFNKEGNVIKWTNVDNPSNWKNGLTKMHQVSTYEIIKELERQFKVSIQYGDINLNEQLSCTFQHENLELALKTSLGPLGVDFNIDGQKVSLK